MSFKKYTLNSLTETEVLGQKIARLLCSQDVILLKGTLGAGKTTLARCIITSLNPNIAHVPSPTFTLVQTYDTSRGSLWHFDLYRIHNAEEVFELGIEEAFDSGISLIEWPERLGRLRLPSSFLEITLDIIQESDVREARLTLSESWDQRWNM
jgi:tRNA threonylcarbamoyladenosine biosynthesis protein TsaE